MATKGGSKMFWIIGGLIVVAGSVGAYFLLRKPKDENKGEGDTDTDTDTDTKKEDDKKGDGGGGNVGGGGAKTYTAPSDLNDSTKIKAFQDWLDTNKPCWLLDSSDNKYKNLSKNAGACNRNAGGTGYGSYGKNTDSAWRSFGTEYMSKKGKPSPTKNTPSEDDINLILKKATGLKSDKTVLQGKPASWVKDWADAIRDSRRTFFWTKNEGGNNKTYKVIDGTILLDYVPLGITYYGSKGGEFKKQESFNSASADTLTKGENLGKAGDVAYDGKYVFVYFPNKSGYKWVYESAITSKTPPISSFMGSDMDLDMFASFDNNLDLNL